jgi:hypothetical protein
MNSPEARLAVYLNDHLAGAVAAVEILETLQECDEVGLKGFVQELRLAIEADRDDLVRIMRAANVAPSSVRRLAGWLSEKAAELKVTLDDPGGHGLRIFELLEVVALGIDGKRALWATLQTIAPAVPSVRDIDYLGLARRAEDQRRAIEERRRQWALTAFTRTA